MGRAVEVCRAHQISRIAAVSNDEGVVTVHCDRGVGDTELRPSPNRRNVVWWGIQVVLRGVFTLWLGYRARGMEKLPATGGGLLLINHQSFLDPLLVGLPLSRPVSYLARDSLFRVPIIGWILRHTYVIPVSRESASASTLRESVRRLEWGSLVGVFPEGTRSRDGSVGPLKPGFIALIRRAKRPIYPVGIAGAHQALPRNRWWLRPARICVVFGDPLDAEEVEQLSQHGEEAALLARVRERIVQCQRDAEAWRRR